MTCALRDKAIVLRPEDDVAIAKAEICAGQVIGFATRAIARGDHVHTQNLAIGELQREYEVGTDVRAVDNYPLCERPGCPPQVRRG